VLVDLQDANLDPAIFAKLEVFNVEGADNPHLTFGHGAHYGIGAPLVKIDLQAVFSRLFCRFPTLRLAVPIDGPRPRSQLLTGGVNDGAVAIQTNQQSSRSPLRQGVIP
jgi:cytochrome P450